jgi:hypothetical protein
MKHYVSWRLMASWEFGSEQILHAPPTAQARQK